MIRHHLLAQWYKEEIQAEQFVGDLQDKVIETFFKDSVNVEATVRDIVRKGRALV